MRKKMYKAKKRWVVASVAIVATLGQAGLVLADTNENVSSDIGLTQASVPETSSSSQPIEESQVESAEVVTATTDESVASTVSTTEKVQTEAVSEESGQVESLSSEAPQADKLPSPLENKPSQEEVEKAMEVEKPTTSASQGDYAVLNKVVYLDAGHGGYDPGASYQGVSEKNLTLAIHDLVKAELEQSGYTVQSTRTDDRYVGLQNRSKQANESLADVFVSIHINASASAASKGIETYYYKYSPNYPSVMNSQYHVDVERMKRSAILAQSIQASTVAATSARDRGVLRETFAVLRETTAPAVLLELGYISNPDERTQLSTADYRRKLASGIVEGIKSYYRTFGVESEKATLSAATGPELTVTPKVENTTSGTYEFTERTGVKNEAKVSSPDLAYYEAGQKVNYDSTLSADGHKWLSYVSHSGTRRYVAVSKLAESTPSRPSQPASVVTPSVSETPKVENTTSGTYEFTERTGVKNEAKVSSPDLAYYEAGQKVNYDSTLSADGHKWLSYVSHSGTRRYVAVSKLAESTPSRPSQPASVVTPSVSETPKVENTTSGTYEFTERTGVKNEAKVSSPDLAYYEAGQKVNYDSTLSADGHKWLSYVSHSGTRRYVAVSKLAESTPSRPSQPASVVTPSVSETPKVENTTSGTYEFTERTGVKNEAKVSSPDLAYYEAGQKVNYDSTLSADGHKWLSYVSHSGTRRYVAVSKLAESTPSRPSQPASVVTPSVSETPKVENTTSGTYEFTERTGVKNEAKVSSLDLAYYEAGQKVNYDSTLSTDGHKWLSYVSHSGTRRYVAVSKLAESTPSPPSQPASVVTPSVSATPKVENTTSGTYEFTERTGVKNEAKVSSPDLAYYEAGQKVNYDSTLSADGHKWLSYVSHSGTRRYVAVSKLAESTPSRPSQPASVVTPSVSETPKVENTTSGTYEFTERTGVKNEAKVSSPDLAYYEAGQKVNYDSTLSADGHKWLSYVSHSGTRRYVAVSKLAESTPSRPSQPASVVTPSVSETPKVENTTSGTYEFTERTGVKNEAKVSSPDLAYYEAGQKVNYDSTLSADGHKWLSYVSHSGTRRYVAVSKLAESTPSRPSQPASVVTPSVSETPKVENTTSGTYEFTERTGVKNEAKVSSPDLAYYEAGQKVNYDSTLSADGHKWLSYVSHSGTRRYVAVSKLAESTPSRPSQPASVVTPSVSETPKVENTTSGTYEFTERTGVKNEAKVSSPDLAYYEAGQKVNYDSTLSADGHKWLSYVSHSGTRRYVAVSKLAESTPSRPSQPASVVTPSVSATPKVENTTSGTYEFTERTGVKNEAKVSSPDLAYYEAGQKVNYDSTLSADGHKWLSYVSHSGTRRYVAVSKLAESTPSRPSQPASVVTPSVSETPKVENTTSGTYEFTERTGVKNEAKVSSPDLAYYEAGQKVNYDSTLSADGHKWLSYVSHSGTRRYVAVSKLAESTPSRPSQPASVVTPSVSETPKVENTTSGTYEFTERTGVKNEAKVSSPDLAYYEAGQKVNYDSTLSADGHKWLSYVSHSGTRRYVAVSKLAESTPSRPSQPASVVTPSVSETPKVENTTSGTYEFTERTGVKNEAKVSSPDLAYYEAGQKVNYDSTLSADGHKWLSYVSHSGTRRYVAVSKLAESTPSRPSQPASVVTPSVSETPKVENTTSGTYEFTERTGVKNEAKVSSPDLAYYEAGQKVNYDSTLSADGHKWLSYVSHSGTRRYVAVSKLAESTPSRPSQPASVVTPSVSETPKVENTTSGTYEFTERTGVKNEAKVSSPDLAYYEAGQKVNYDSTLSADGHKWLSYVSHSGTRRYVAVSKLAEAKSDRSEASSKLVQHTVKEESSNFKASPTKKVENGYETTVTYEGTGLYQVKIDNVDKDKGIVKMAVWSEESAQDDIRWYELETKGTSAQAMFNVRNYKDAGRYQIHLYQSSADKIEFLTAISQEVKRATFDVPYYSQRDPRWAYKTYGGYTVDRTGCVPTILSMVFSGLSGKDVKPTDVADYLYNETIYFDRLGPGTIAQGKVEAAKQWNMEATPLSSLSAIETALKEGHYVTAAVQGNPFVRVYGSLSHELLLSGYKDGKTYVRDPYTPALNGWHSLANIYNQQSYFKSDSLAGSKPFFKITDKA